MRNLTITLALTALLMAAACEIDTQPFMHEPVATQFFHNDPWRRTENGWEHTAAWNVRGEPIAARIHPSLVACMTLLISVGGLLAADKTVKFSER